MSIKPSQLATELEKYLSQYKEEITEDVIRNSDIISKEARDELKRVSPKDRFGTRGRHYADGWRISSSTTKNYVSKKVYNATDYQLTHLLEFGHATRNGGHVNAQPHIRPTEDKYRNKFIRDLEKDIKRWHLKN